jgi:hypothetical protein
MSKPTIASLKTEIASLQVQVFDATNAVARSREETELVRSELAAAQAVVVRLTAALEAAPAPAAKAPKTAAAPYPRVREYSDRNGRWFRKTSWTANRHSTVEIAGPGGDKVAPAAAAIAGAKAALTGSDAGLMDGVRL